MGVIRRGHAPAEDLLHETLVGIALEAASLRWEIEHAQDEGKNVEQLSSRRIDGLAKIANVILSMRRVGIEAPIDPATVERLKQLWLSTVARVAHETLSGDQAEQLLESYVARLDRAEGR